MTHLLPTRLADGLGKDVSLRDVGRENNANATFRNPDSPQYGFLVFWLSFRELSTFSLYQNAPDDSTRRRGPVPSNGP